MTTPLATLSTYLNLGDFESARRCWLDHLLDAWSESRTLAAQDAVIVFSALADVVDALADAA